MGWLEMILGVVITWAVLVDVFITILYARIGSGILGYRLAKLIWYVFRWATKPLGAKRGLALSYCGPVILVALILLWTLGLDLGAALIIHPNLGGSIVSGHGDTATDFITALYVAGSSLSVVGSSSYEPQTDLFRLVYLFNSLVGATLISLVTTYLLQVYNALLRRNTLGLKVHLLTAETDDGAELLAGIGPEGNFSDGFTVLADLAPEIIQIKESHHFYPVLFYFRFGPAFYSVSQFSLICLDAVTLIKSGLDDDQYGWFKEATPVEQTWRGCIMLLMMLRDTFLPGRPAEDDDTPDPATLERWRARYAAGLRRLRQAGIQTIANETEGFEIYVSLRRRWEHIVTTLAPTMAYPLEEIDPASYRPQLSDERAAFRSRRHAMIDPPE
jgi:hypothetical protein